MSGGYLIRSDKTMVEWEEQSYDSEDLLQDLLAQYPNLLAGSQIDPVTPRRWLLIDREMGLPSEDGGGERWSVDHLFLDQDAIPTLVEVKRSSDTRIRREVIGQMLEYAANANIYWPVDTIRARFEARCEAAKLDPLKVLADRLGNDQDLDLFWQKVDQNLKSGNMRLVFVADKIPTELQRIVEFLNAQMSPAQVIAVEIPQYAAGEFKSYFPRVIGQTIEAQDRKKIPSRRNREWDAASFLAELEARRSPQEVEVAKSILEWAHQQGLRIAGGKGATHGTLYTTLDVTAGEFTPISLYTYGGQISVQFDVIGQFTPFDQEAKRAELRDHINQIEGVKLPIDKLSGYPVLRFSNLIDESALAYFLAGLDKALDEVRHSYSD